MSASSLEATAHGCVLEMFQLHKTVRIYWAALRSHAQMLHGLAKQHGFSMHYCHEGH